MKNVENKFESIFIRAANKKNYDACLNTILKDFKNFPSKEIFNPTIAMKRYNRDIDWRKVEKGPEMDDEDGGGLGRGRLRGVHHQPDLRGVGL